MNDEANLRKLMQKMKEEHEKQMAMLEVHYDAFQTILYSMPKESVTRVWVDFCFNVHITGTREILIAAMRALRRQGYEADARPISGRPGYSTYFRKEGMPEIWFNFTSTQYRRVKVGTQTVVQDVYETVCDEHIYEEAG